MDKTTKGERGTAMEAADARKLIRNLRKCMTMVDIAKGISRSQSTTRAIFEGQINPPSTVISALRKMNCPKDGS